MEDEEARLFGGVSAKVDFRSEIRTRPDDKCQA